MTMTLALAFLVFVSVASSGAAVYVYVTERSRRALVGRAGGSEDSARASLARLPASAPRVFWKRLSALVPSSWASDATVAEQLVQAGHDSTTAPLAFAAVRVVLGIGLPLTALALGASASLLRLVLYLSLALLIGVLLPKAWLARAVRLRQERIRRALPDALDLLVVCIEAGISLDAAILRVARELNTVHPTLAGELLVVNRKTNAGMRREDALRSLQQRTGVEEVRALVSHIIQGERWGTSSGKVLRVYAETLRRQRKQRAEKTAATLPVKMLLPLGLFIFPAIFVVLMGPVVINIMALMKK